MADLPVDTPRRHALLTALKAGIATTVLAILYPVVWFLKPRRATQSGALEMLAPYRVSDLVNGGGTPFDFAGKPCLLVLSEAGQKRVAAGEPVQADDVRAFNAICTHVDCTVRYRAEEEDIYCSCHDGVYDLRGRVVSGPPPRPLQMYSVTLRGEPGQEEILVSRES